MKRKHRKKMIMKESERKRSVIMKAKEEEKVSKKYEIINERKQ